jgi:crotonobetainyl-CoA:carnitine CoA-transferase CaiB-like acyl-CoA transferase
MAQTEVAVSLIGEHYLEYTYNDYVPKPMGNRSSYAAPHGCYPCKGVDEWCAIAVFTDDEWYAFCDALGDPDWTDDPKFADQVARLRNVEELDEHVREWTSQHDACVVMETLQAAGVAAGVVQRAPDTLADPQLKWDGAVIELDHPVAGKRLYPGIPFRMSGASGMQSTPAPTLGEHTEEIARDILGLSEDEISRLLNEDVLHSPANTESSGKGMFD